MPIRAALFLCLLASGAQAAAFDDLKAELASCLRYELDGAKARRAPGAAKAGTALQACATEIDRLDRADGRRIRGDRGLSPSTRSVLDGVLGRSGRRGSAGRRY